MWDLDPPRSQQRPAGVPSLAPGVHVRSYVQTMEQPVPSHSVPLSASNFCYSTASSLVSRVEESSSSTTRNSRPKAQKRKYCEHCSQDLTLKTYKKHRNLYFKDDGTWMKASSGTPNPQPQSKFMQISFVTRSKYK